jgi:putative phosphoribosyl transferase
MKLIDHREVGRLLADQVISRNPARPVVVAVPPGGARIGWEIARRLNAPLDVIMLSTVHVPGRAGSPLGCAVDGRFYPDEAGCRDHRVTREYAEILVSATSGSGLLREREMRHGEPGVDVRDRTVILVSDGAPGPVALAAAVAALQDRGVARILYATPVAPAERVAGFDEVLTAFLPEERSSVMLVNAGYRQTTDREIAELLESSWSTLQRSSGVKGGRTLAAL